VRRHFAAIMGGKTFFSLFRPNSVNLGGWSVEACDQIVGYCGALRRS
jgi:hypothetical protein